MNTVTSHSSFCSISELGAFIRAAFAAAFRAIPQFRGKTRIVRLVNRQFLKWGAVPQVRSPMRDGTLLQVDLRSTTEYLSFYSGRYEDDLLSLVKAFYDPATTFLDVGANIGFYSVAIGNFARSSGAAGQVFSFEPHPNNFKRLKSNLELNDLTPLVSCAQFALSDKPAILSLIPGEDGTSGSETGNMAISFQSNLPPETALVQAVPLDEFLNERSLNIGFIKVDIEGHEDFFLDGARQTLAMHQPIMLLEVNKAYYRNRGVALDESILGRLPSGYSVFCPRAGVMTRLSSLEECTELDNVFAIPEAKLSAVQSRAAATRWS